jgi:hypothetical protein
MDSEDESDWDRDFASEVEDGPIGIGLALDLSDTTDDNTSRPLIRGFSTSPADPKDDDIWDDDFTEDESSRSAKDSAGESKLAAPPLVNPSSTSSSASTHSSSSSTSSSPPSSAATTVATGSSYSSPSSSNAGSPSTSSRATLCRQPSVARLAQVSLSRTESKLDTAAIERSSHGTLGHSISRRFQKQPGGGGSFLERLAKMQENPKVFFLHFSFLLFLI